MSIIIPANSASGGGGFGVANSLRFNRGSSDYLRWNSSPSGNRQKFTWSAWFKRSSFGATQILGSASYSGGDEGYLFLSSGGILGWQSTNSGDGNLTTARSFKDTSAWYHVVFSVDTTQSTATNRIKLYINGSQYTWDGNTTQPNQNQSLYWNVGDTYYPYIGRRNGGDYFDGYMSEIVQVNNAQLAADSFGEFDEDSGIWKPIDVSGLTFGDTGYYLNFQDSSALGNDVSGENHDWTSYNLAAVDQSTDTCTNNFCTWNPLAKYTNTLTFSEGNLKTVMSSQAWHSARGNFGFSSGKWYWECKLLGNQSNYTGVVDESAIMNTTNAYTQNGNTLFYNGSGGEMEVNGSQTSNNYGNFSETQVCGVAVDADNNKISIYKNGSAIVSNYSLSTTRTGFLFPTAASLDYSTEIPTGQNTNFGSPLYSESGGNSDGNGYGNFNQSVPSGYFALNTKNLAEYG